MSDLKPINRLIQLFERHIKDDARRDTLQLTLVDAQLIRVYLYDLKLRMIKERDNLNER